MSIDEAQTTLSDWLRGDPALSSGGFISVQRIARYVHVSLHKKWLPTTGKLPPRRVIPVSLQKSEEGYLKEFEEGD